MTGWLVGGHVKKLMYVFGESNFSLCSLALVNGQVRLQPYFAIDYVAFKFDFIPERTCLAWQISYSADILAVVYGLPPYDYDIAKVEDVVLLEMEKFLSFVRNWPPQILKMPEFGSRVPVFRNLQSMVRAIMRTVLIKDPFVLAVKFILVSSRGQVEGGELCFSPIVVSELDGLFPVVPVSE